jgi:hypothetical protein
VDLDSRGELLAALSLGIDLGFGQPMEHVLRPCLISLRLAVGCHADAHEPSSVPPTSGGGVVRSRTECQDDAFDAPE